MKTKPYDELDEVPDSLVWLYLKLDEIRNPPFLTIFLIVTKVYFALVLLSSIIILAIFLLCLLLFLIITGTAEGFFIWLAALFRNFQLDSILPTFR